MPAVSIQGEKAMTALRGVELMGRAASDLISVARLRGDE
jgi:hypothetical protein